MKQLASALILSRLYYCNSRLAGLSKSKITTLQRVQNAAACMVLNLRPCDSISDGLRQLHWLPIESRIRFNHVCWCTSSTLAAVRHMKLFNLLLIMQVVATGLRSASNARYILPILRTVFGKRAFSFYGPKSWNALTDRCHSIESTDSFKK